MLIGFRGGGGGVGMGWCPKVFLKLEVSINSQIDSFRWNNFNLFHFLKMSFTWEQSGFLSHCYHNLTICVVFLKYGTRLRILIFSSFLENPFLQDYRRDKRTSEKMALAPHAAYRQPEGGHRSGASTPLATRLWGGGAFYAYFLLPGGGERAKVTILPHENCIWNRWNLDAQGVRSLATNVTAS